jgi:hypothetical protein
MMNYWVLPDIRCKKRKFTYSCRLIVRAFFNRETNYHNVQVFVRLRIYINDRQHKCSFLVRDAKKNW